MTYKCERIQREEQTAAYIRTRTPVEKLPEVMGSVYGIIAGILGARREAPAGPPYTAYYNMDMQDLDVEIGFPIQAPFPETGEVRIGTIPAGAYASCIHTGPYGAIEPVYTALAAWIEEQGLTPSGVSYEFYLNDPGSTPPGSLLTQVLFPIKPRG